MNSFYALIAVGLDVFRMAFSKSKIKETAAAVVVGVGLLVGSTGDVQAACDPPVYDVCFHRDSGDWTTSGYARMAVEFPVLPPIQSYEVVWHGLKRFTDFRGRPYFTYDDVSNFGHLWDRNIGYAGFWWDPLDPSNNYSCSVYEGHWDYSGSRPVWVRGKWIFQVDFYSYQDAAYVSIDNRSSVLDYELSSYYCTVDRKPSLPGGTWRHGYTEGYWSARSGRYQGDPGSPRFHYRQSCSVTVLPPLRTRWNTRPW